MKTCKCGFTGEDKFFAKERNACLTCYKERKKKYYEKNKEHILLQEKQYYTQNKDKRKIYVQNNKEKYMYETIKKYTDSLNEFKRAEIRARRRDGAHLSAWGNNKSRDFMLKVNKILDDRPIERVDHSKIVRSTLRIIYAHKKPRAE